MKKLFVCIVVLFLLTGCSFLDDPSPNYDDGYESGYEYGYETGYFDGSADGYAEGWADALAQYGIEE